MLLLAAVKAWPGLGCCSTGADQVGAAVGDVVAVGTRRLAVAVGVAVPCTGTYRCCPTLKKLQSFSPLAAISSFSVTPYRSAMPRQVSPLTTTYVGYSGARG